MFCGVKVDTLELTSCARLTLSLKVNVLYVHAGSSTQRSVLNRNLSETCFTWSTFISTTHGLVSPWFSVTLKHILFVIQIHDHVRIKANSLFVKHELINL